MYSFIQRLANSYSRFDSQWKDARDAKKAKDHTKLETYEAGYGTKSKATPEEMEKVQPLSNHFQAIDAVYFNGANKDGFMIITGTARRPHGAINAFIIFKYAAAGFTSRQE